MSGLIVTGVIGFLGMSSLISFAVGQKANAIWYTIWMVFDMQLLQGWCTMKLMQGLWRVLEYLNVCLYKDEGYYFDDEEDLRETIYYLAKGGGWPASAISKTPKHLALPSHFIFNN